MERRVLLSIFLAFLVLYAWQALFTKPAPKPGAPGSVPVQSKAGAQPGPTEGASPVSTAGAAAEAAPVAAVTPENTPPPAPSAAALVGDNAEHDVRIETQDVIAVFTNRGARLKSWQLKRYRNQR